MGTLDLNIIIIGGGIGGLAAAAALARAGADVEVVERADIIAEAGAGLQVTPNGMAVLDALGLTEPVRQVSVASRAVSLRDGARGREVFRLDLSSRSGRYRMIHRSELIARLLAAAETAGARVTTGQTIERVHPGTPPRIETADGVTREADLIIGADGLKSVTRPALNGITRPMFTGQVAWRAIQPNLIGHPPEAWVHMGPGRHLVSYPIDDGHRINIVGVEERDTWADEGWHHTDDPANLLRAFSGFGGEVPQMLAGVENVGLWGLFRHPVAREWHGAGVAILGDAAHPTLPFLAQGANMAIEDSWTLSECLRHGAGVTDALKRYQSLRQQRCSRIVEAANKNARAYHLSPGPVRWAAHAGLRLAGLVAPRMIAGRFDWIYDYNPVQAASSTQTGT